MSNLFVKFFMLKIEINRAIDEDRNDDALKLRQELFSVWKSIMAFQPKTLEERKMLGLFLLDQLTEKTPEYEVKLIRKKMIELFWEASAEFKKVNSEHKPDLQQAI